MFLVFFKCFLAVFEVCNLIYGIIISIIDEIKLLFTRIEPKSIENELVLITGAGHGLGRSMALYLMNFKPVLVLWDVNKENCDRTAIEVRRRGCVAYTYEVDVSDFEQVQAAAADVEKNFGNVYMLINNVGVLNCQRITDLKPEKIERTFRVNIFSHFWTVKAFLPSMMAKRRGHIVGISSNRGLFGRAYFTDYSATKFGINGFMQALEDEVRELEISGIVFTTVCPSAIDTGLSRPFETRFPSLLPIMDVDYAARFIIDEVLKDKGLVIFPFGHKVLHYILRDCPKPIYNLLTDFIGYAVQPMPTDPSLICPNPTP